MHKEYLNEIWKDIKGYEGLYQVSNFGRVKKLERDLVYKDGKVVHYKEQILSPSIRANGYLQVHLSINMKKNNFYVHRLVAEAFISNPDNLPQVNHKDEDKTNNFVWVNEDCSVDYNKTNLEWCDAKYNTNYGTKKMRAGLKLRNRKSCKPIIQYDLAGNVVAEFNSINDVVRKYGYKKTGISRCCNNKPRYKTAYGYIWKFKETA